MNNSINLFLYTSVYSPFEIKTRNEVQIMRRRTGLVIGSLSAERLLKRPEKWVGTLGITAVP